MLLLYSICWSELKKNEQKLTANKVLNIRWDLYSFNSSLENFSSKVPRSIPNLPRHFVNIVLPKYLSEWSSSGVLGQGGKLFLVINVTRKEQGWFITTYHLLKGKKNTPMSFKNSLDKRDCTVGFGWRTSEAEAGSVIFNC